MVYGLGHTIVRLFGSEQARQRAVKGARRNFIAVGITIHTKRYTALQKCGFSLDFNIYTGSKKAYLKNTNFYQSSNNQDFQGFAPFEPTEAVLYHVSYIFMI